MASQEEISSHRVAAAASVASDDSLVTLTKEFEILEAAASGLEARLEEGTVNGAADPASESQESLRKELDNVVARLAQIPFDMAATPASTIHGVMTKVRQLEGSLAAGSSDSDVPLIRSISKDLTRIIGTDALTQWA